MIPIPDQPQDDWFKQFDPANASPSSPTAGGGTMGTVANGGLQVDPATPTAPTGGGGLTFDQISQAWMSSPYPGTVDGLKQFFASHPEYAAAGITLGGSKGDKLFGPGGEFWGDGVLSAGVNGGQGKTPFGGPSSGGGGQGSALAGLGYGFGDSMKPFTGQYALPTLGEFQSSPFYGAGLDAFNRANQNSAAARGTLLNGRTNEAMNKSALDYGLTQYGQLAGLNAGVFDRNFDVFKRNQDAPFSKNVTLAELGRPT